MKQPIFHILRFFVSIFIIFSFSFLLAEDTLENLVLEEEPQSEEQAIEQSENQEMQPKILRLEIVTDFDSLASDTLYVGQHLDIQYRVLLLSESRIVHTEFSPPLEQSAPKGKQKSPKKEIGVSVVKDSGWVRDGDYWTISYTFKILKPTFTVPSLVVHVQNDNVQDSMQTEAVSLDAQILSSNPIYSGVVASHLSITDYTLEDYDGANNRITMDLEGQNGNLEDFHLRTALEQEFGQGNKFGADASRASIIAIVPKGLESIDFSYFNIDKKEFENLNIPNNVTVFNTGEEIKGDLNPKSSFLSVANVGVTFLLLLSLILTLVKRSYFFALVSVLLLAALAYRFLSNTHSISTVENAKVLILPTPNSTTLLVITKPAKLKAIDKKNGFYKVTINAKKVGWISENQVK